MTDPNDLNDRERALASLFERTARPLPDEERARLGRRARDVGSFPRRGLPKAAMIWAPALAAAAAVLYLAVPMRHAAPVTDAPSTALLAPAPAEVTAPHASAEVAPTTADDTSDPDDPAVAVLSGEPSETDPFDLGPLMMAAEPLRHRDGVQGRAMPERQLERRAP